MCNVLKENRRRLEVRPRQLQRRADADGAGEGRPEQDLAPQPEVEDPVGEEAPSLQELAGTLGW